MSGWAAIALENQALLTKALENLAAAERERDTARDLAVSLENLVHEARADAEHVRAELVETAARGLALELGALVAIAQKNHYRDPATVRKSYCYACSAYAGEPVYYPCLTARLADALEAAQEERDAWHRTHDANLDFVGGVAETWEAEAKKARAEATALGDGLRSLEWGEKDDTGNPNYDACQVCGWYRFRGCHSENCALVPLLARLAPS